jgi:Protein of unknown function (DUF4058)
MPLRDHFHPPLTHRGKWESFNTFWLVALAKWLNHTLPRDEFTALVQVHLGSRVEADVAEFEETARGHRDGAVGTLPAVAAPTATVPAFFPDDLEIQIQDTLGSLRLAGVIEVVSPSNKKEVNERQAFVAKCATYLRQGVGLAIVDVVTERLANLHNELMQTVGGPTPPQLPKGAGTYVAGYRPVHRDGRNEIDVWAEVAPVGQPIPSVPLALRRGPLIALDLDTTYTEALPDSNL